MNIGNGGERADQLRGLLPKETLVLIDETFRLRSSLGSAGFSQGQDINYPPSDDDHILHPERRRQCM
jgi:hypothetical protein